MAGVAAGEPVKCVIVAAGMGLRLRDIAPLKPLAPLLGAPLISHVIDCALAGGATEFVVVTGYEGARLEKVLYSLAAARGLRLSCVRNPDWRASNGLSVAAAGPVVSGKFLLLMSDHLFDPEIVRDLLRAGAEAPGVVLAIDRRLDNPLVDLEDVTRVDADPDGRIRRIGKLIAGYNAFDTGIFLASPRLIEEIEACVAEGGVGSISAGMQRLADQGLAEAYDIGDRFWIDIDDAAAFGRAEREAGQLMATQ
jgi:1L-myo-inositol 1-phosphate cytidylyltransferase